MPDIPLQPFVNKTSADPKISTGELVKQENNTAVDFSNVLDLTIFRGITSSAPVVPDNRSKQKLLTIATHSLHFSSNMDGENSKENFQQKMLGIRAYRQQIIASNIANSDTPGYKAVDVDINFAADMNPSESLSLSTSSSNHINGSAIRQSLPLYMKFHTPSQASVDGNTVEMDVERQKFAENSVMYQFSLERVSSEFKHMVELFQELK